ncbi:MAG: TetR/AcrR family transcriptional regulator [Solirubrobacteraceae bacterium]
MESDGRTQLRADAARNVTRITDAAYVVFAGRGAAGSMEDVAAEADVGIATVYRRFPRKVDLLRIVLYRRWDEVITPGLARAKDEFNPREAMRIALEVAVEFVANDRVMLSAAADAGLMTMDLAQRFGEPVGDVLRRGQRAGVFRTDLVDDDIARVVLMLFATLPTFDEGSDGWRRYLDLMLDVLTAQTTALAPPSPVHEHQPNLPPIEHAT